MKIPDGLPVTDLQRALREIFQAEGMPDPPIPDGVFGPETTRAVQQFQRSAGLNPSGKADLTTWNAVFARAARLRKERSPALGASFFPPGAVIAPGSTGDAVLAVQIMLGTLSDNFINFDAVERTGIYDEKTAGQIRRFQGCAALPESGVTDKSTWNALCRFYAVWRSGGSRIIGETERVPPFGRPTA